MAAATFSLILLPTLRCDAACDYCFENKADIILDIIRLPVILEKVIDWLDHQHIESLCIYWQGGEVMTLSAEWFERADRIIVETAADRKKTITNYLQSNMIAYDRSWNPVIADMFGNNIGTSMDFPNIYRKVRNGGTEKYMEIWSRNILEAKSAGIEIGVIAVPNDRTLEMGAECFYSYFVDELGITNIQVNLPFPGGSPSDAKKTYPIDADRLSRFLIDLFELWQEHGVMYGVRIEPYTWLSEYFSCGRKQIPCIWRDNCAGGFICIGPDGYVSQCDCWAASYTDSRFGNIFDPGSLADLLHRSEPHRLLQSRPVKLIQQEDCIQCDYLAICHGGCPVRAYTVHGNVLTKDPYCETYKSLFNAVSSRSLV